VEDNNVNVLCLGARAVGSELAVDSCAFTSRPNSQAPSAIAAASPKWPPSKLNSAANRITVFIDWGNAVYSIRRQVSVACQAGESASSVSVLPEKRYWRTCLWPIQLGNQAPSTAWITIPASASTMKVPQYPT
jgi:hypothetical protein